MDLWMGCLIFHVSFFPIHKNDSNYTCHLSTSWEPERTNEMSVKGFELSSIKILWPYKVQCSIQSLYFSWHLPQVSKVHCTLLATAVPRTASCLVFDEAIIGKCWTAAAAVFHSSLGTLFSILDRISENPIPVACFAVHFGLLCRHGSVGQKESIWEASEPTFPDDTLIARIYCFTVHLKSYKMSPTIVKEKLALPRCNFVTSKCF